MKTKILVLNGPCVNMIGYGTDHDYSWLHRSLIKFAKEKEDLSIVMANTNHIGEMIDVIQDAFTGDYYDIAIVNPGVDNGEQLLLTISWLEKVRKNINKKKPIFSAIIPVAEPADVRICGGINAAWFAGVACKSYGVRNDETTFDTYKRAIEDSINRLDSTMEEENK